MYYSYVCCSHYDDNFFEEYDEFSSLSRFFSLMWYIYWAVDSSRSAFRARSLLSSSRSVPLYFRAWFISIIFWMIAQEYTCIVVAHRNYLYDTQHPKRVYKCQPEMKNTCLMNDYYNTRKYLILLSSIFQLPVSQVLTRDSSLSVQFNKLIA